MIQHPTPDSLSEMSNLLTSVYKHRRKTKTASRRCRQIALSSLERCVIVFKSQNSSFSCFVLEQSLACSDNITNE